MATVNIRPDPKILIALTHTPLQPLDALCELIDNAIDSFAYAKQVGTPIEFPLVTVEVPGLAEVTRGAGIVRVTDNGLGLPLDLATKALQAGYSGKNRYDTLGLFGMGLNVATGKLGQLTRFITREEGAPATRINVDLVELAKSRDFNVPYDILEHLDGLTHGTVIEVGQWWEDGTPNSGFIRKLASYSKAAVRQNLGRRYATLLRDERVRILVNGEPCVPFEHCFWADSRFVERGRTQIPALFRFDDVIATTVRCNECGGVIPFDSNECPACHIAHFRTVEERIRGWVGIQRFDDANDFGIDLIRNGRAIRIFEQRAFFEFTDAFGQTIKDYPIDNPFGRIVGEIHLDHVPVDFMKQDFQRNSEEWRRAMTFIRGESSLQPTQPNADKNESFIYKLYQGYRRVRIPGKHDLYMGYYDADKPKRISRETERDYYQRFLNKEQGYHDDVEWYKLVEQADTPPLPELVDCPVCHAQNMVDAETCLACGAILLGKQCVKCHETIERSAASCPKCGASQLPEITLPWRCEVCEHLNDHTQEKCGNCGSARGTRNPISREALDEACFRDDARSARGLRVRLADGSHSDPIDVESFTSIAPLHAFYGGPAVPYILFRDSTGFRFYIDPQHRLFRALGVRPELIIASEVASFIYDVNRRLVSQYPKNHNIGKLMYDILEERWSDDLEDSADRVRRNIRELFDGIRAALVTAIGDRAADLYSEMTENQNRALVENLIGERIDIARLGELKSSGEFINYVDESTVVEYLRMHPDLFFDGNVWPEAYATIKDLPEAVTREVQERLKATYLNCLEDIAAFLHYQNPEPVLIHRARSSLDLLSRVTV